MHRESFLVLLGILVVISPFAGLPLSWLVYILPILGILILIIGISLRRERHARENHPTYESIAAQTLTQ